MLSGLNDFSVLGFLALRLVVAIVFIYHGLPKVRHPENSAGGMGMSASTVRLLGLVELLGGLAIGIGVFTQWAALALIVVMVGAIYYKVQKWKVPFSTHSGTGWEFDLALLAVLLFLLTNAY